MSDEWDKDTILSYYSKDKIISGDPRTAEYKPNTTISILGTNTLGFSNK